MSKYVLTARMLHFGHIKETFKAGAVIEHDEANNRLIIDGRTFNDTRDLEIIKRHTEKDPLNSWLVPYSVSAVNKAKKIGEVPLTVPEKKGPVQLLKVIQSDSDLTEEIDVRDTQISKKTAAKKEEERKRIKATKLEIVQGDQSVEDRIAELKGKNDPSAIAERANLKASGPAALPIVKDDSLGTSVGKSEVSMNAGQALPNAKMVAAKTAAAKALADARKAEAAKLRGTHTEPKNAAPQQPMEQPRQKRKYVRKDPNAPVVPKRKYTRRVPAASAPAATVTTEA
jgi:hypothetical protein